MSYARLGTRDRSAAPDGLSRGAMNEFIPSKCRAQGTLGRGL